MASDAFKPGHKIRVTHKHWLHGAGHSTTVEQATVVHEGEVIEHVKDDVWRVTFGGFGLRFLVPEKDIQDAEQSGNAQVQARETAQRIEEGTNREEPQAGEGYRGQ